ncbi:expressed unknown protein [Seminavis robusta]|uniref:Uncharacterized protein n=1 Tax=Seminavis robusta TaxID=568900 RepID=A0A9N8HES4_9STRA|nr:expressed unknown protein [Seminavis robusta]|eukprot:Sro317_g115740.1 n/a (379) ;mRNA; r:33573-34803
MAKLFTHHDPFHIHKILGLFVLLHFLYRFLYGALIRGFVFCSVHHANDGLCSPDKVHWDAICVVLHAILSWSSLLLPLPKTRNYSSPMIWTEFRLHSITFATRGVVGSLISLYGLWPQQLLLNFFAKLALVLATCYAADWITQKHGCTEKRTTNAMPYPTCITPEMQQNVKYIYAMKQFAAALSCISEDPATPWATLLAIQGAPLLMTLVRKGKIQSLTYHRAYILQLATPMYIFLLGNLLHWNRYAGVSLAVHDNMKRVTVVAAVHLLTTYLRITLRYSKFLTWAISTAFIVVLTQIPILWNFVSWCHTNPYGLAFLVSRHVLLGQGILRHYVPVFTLAKKAPEKWEDVAMAWVNRMGSGIFVRVAVDTTSSKKLLD